MQNMNFNAGHVLFGTIVDELNIQQAVESLQGKSRLIHAERGQNGWFVIVEWTRPGRTSSEYVVWQYSRGHKAFSGGAYTENLLLACAKFEGRIVR